jgi:hypothetical protein
MLRMAQQMVQSVAKSTAIQTTTFTYRRRLNLRARKKQPSSMQGLKDGSLISSLIRNACACAYIQVRPESLGCHGCTKFGGEMCGPLICTYNAQIAAIYSVQTVFHMHSSGLYLSVMSISERVRIHGFQFRPQYQAFLQVGAPEFCLSRFPVCHGS